MENQGRPPSGRIAFSFHPEKVVQALVYFSERGVRNLTKLKAAKLLFFADKYHLLKYGRPVVGDRYVCMNYGPVPSEALSLMNDALSPVEVEDPARDEFRNHLRIIDRGFWGKLDFPHFAARGATNREVFSPSDFEALDFVVREYGPKSARVLVDLTHEEEAFKCTDPLRTPGSAVDIPYELFFKGAPDAADMLRVVEAEQEDRDAAGMLAG
jgi:uncharacterized phage-associated protein